MVTVVTVFAKTTEIDLPPQNTQKSYRLKQSWCWNARRLIGSPMCLLNLVFRHFNVVRAMFWVEIVKHTAFDLDTGNLETAIATKFRFFNVGCSFPQHLLAMSFARSSGDVISTAPPVWVRAIWHGTSLFAPLGWLQALVTGASRKHLPREFPPHLLFWQDEAQYPLVN